MVLNTEELPIVLCVVMTHLCLLLIAKMRLKQILGNDLVSAAMKSIHMQLLPSSTVSVNNLFSSSIMLVETWKLPSIHWALDSLAEGSLSKATSMQIELVPPGDWSQARVQCLSNLFNILSELLVRTALDGFEGGFSIGGIRLTSDMQTALFSLQVREKRCRRSYHVSTTLARSSEWRSTARRL